jgi:DNA polymerase III subunit epsilon
VNARRNLETPIASFPEAPGVYLFYGPGDLLLYVGKSKSLRSRIRAHFSSPSERSLCRRVRRIEIRETAGELGALLLESKLIKELRPLHNVASKRRRRIVLARRAATKDGYVGVQLEAVDRIPPNGTDTILGIFKHTTQAKEFLSAIARSHRLCPKLLHLERAQSYCFSYHLGRCDGACMGEEDPAAYNRRLEAAFEERRIKAWPFEGSVIFNEKWPASSHEETFLIDNWCLLASSHVVGKQVIERVEQPHRFDYDSYKILLSFLMDNQRASQVEVVPRQTALP